MRLFIRGFDSLEVVEQMVLAQMAAEIGVRVHKKTSTDNDTIVCEFDDYKQEVEMMCILTNFDCISWSPHDYRSN